MTQLEIKQKIENNNQIIESQFTLNNTVRKLLAENAELQKQCQHQYEGGYCIYCYKEEDE